MGVRYYADYTTLNTNIDVKVEIHDALFSGTSAKLKGIGSGWLDYTHQRLEPSQYTEIQKGEVSASLHIQTEAHRTLRSDIISSSEGRFELYLYFNDVLEWKGTVLPDLCPYNENVNEKFNITAKDFSLLKKDTFTLSTTRETIITTIEDILSDFSLPIITATSWTESNTTPTNDFLRQIYHDRTALRQFVEGDDTDVTITNEEALRWILRGYGLTLKQSGGALRIDQFTEYEDPTTVLLSTYNSGFQSQAETDVTQTAKVTIESDNKPNAGIKRVKNTFSHRTQESVIVFPSSIRLSNSETRTVPFNVAGGGFPVKLQAGVSAIVTTSIDLNSKGYVLVRITAGQYSWVDGAWQEVTSNDRFNTIELVQGRKIDSVTPGSFDYEYTGVVSIQTSNIPTDATSGLEIEFQSARLGALSLNDSNPNSVNSSVCDYTGIQFEADFEEGNSQSIQYELVNADNFTLELDYPATYYGDGPNTNSPSALRYSSTFSDITSSGWQRRGGGGSRSFHSNLLHEILDPRRGARRVLNGVIKSDFVPHKVLSYDSTFFYYLGGSFDGYTGNWNIQAVEIVIQDNEEAISVLLEQRIQSLVSGLGSVVDLTTRDLRKIQNLTNRVGITTVTYNNEVTTTLGAQLDTPMRGGIEYWVVNEAQLDWRNLQAGIYPVVPLLVDGGAYDWVSGTISIEEQIIDAPSGSLIIKAPAQSEIDDNVAEEQGRDFELRITTLNTNLDILDGELDTLNTVTLPALNDELDTLEADLNTLNTVTLPNLQAELDAVLPITETKISDGAISTPKLQTNAITAGTIATGAVTALKIATDAVIANKIQAGAVIAGKLGADAVVANNIAADAITTNKILAGAVTALKIDVDDLAANSAFIDELMAQSLILQTGGFIRSTSYTAGTSGFIINADGTGEVNNWTVRGTLNADDINAGTLSVARLDIDAILAENASITGTLTMGAGGEITNVGGDFLINSSGVQVESGTVLLGDPEKSFSIYRGAVNVGGLYGQNSGAGATIWLRSYDGTLSLAGDDNLTLFAGNDITLNATGVVSFVSSRFILPLVNGTPTSVQNGMIWYDPVAGDLYYRRGGATRKVTSTAA